MNNTMKLNRKEINKVRHFIQAAFPEYTGFKVTLEFTDKAVNVESYWDSGYCDKYVLVQSNGQTTVIPENGGMSKNRVAPVVPTIDLAIVQKSYNAAAPQSIRIFFPTSMAPKFLPVAV